MLSPMPPPLLLSTDPEQLRPHALQDLMYRSRARFIVVRAGRGSGKTLIAKRKTIRALGTRHPRTDKPWFFYGLPTTAQAKRVAWESLKNLLPKEWYQPRTHGKTFYESDRIIKTCFGSELHVVGLDTPQRIEGNQWCGGVLDECSDQRPKVFDLTVRPALTDYKGWCLRIGVPKRFGIGAEDFNAAFEFALRSSDPDDLALCWESGTVVSAAELEKIKASLDERDYNEQYLALKQSSSGAIFHAFDEELNVDSKVSYNPNRPIVVGSDFNVDPMCWVLAHRTDNSFEVFKELKIRNTNTEETLATLYRAYDKHRAGWEFFGDASGKARKTSASRSDYIQILNDERFYPKEVYYASSNPSVIDRFASCNAMLKNAKGERRLMIHPSCERLIADLKFRSFKPGTKEPADKGDMGHMSDALGYPIHMIWPLAIDDSGGESEVIIHA